jgi:beta-N-acetylhexosaminidase
VDVTGGWSREELWPFAELIRIGAADAIMTGHIFNRALDSSHPATLSWATVEGLLRGELGYGGVVISDDLTMGAIRANYRLEDAVVLAVEAGVDLLTIGNPQAVADMDRVIGALAAAVQSGRIPESRIDASYERIRALRSRLLR